MKTVMNKLDTESIVNKLDTETVVNKLDTESVANKIDAEVVSNKVDTKTAVNELDTIIKEIDPSNIDIDIIKKFGEILRNGGTVIFPTETVYGLGANALDEDAARKIYQAKGRPSDNPLLVHVSKVEDVYEIVQEVSEKARRLMDRFWPGPLTILFKKKPIVPDRTSGGLGTVAIRMPSDKVALAIIEAAKVPIAAPSANISGRPSPTKAKHLVKDMKGRVDAILLGGDCNYGVESTIVDVSGEKPIILRPGFVTKEMIEEELNEEVIIDPSILKKEDNINAKAPGMKYKHYSPNAEVYIVSGSKKERIEKIKAFIEKNNEANLKSGVLLMGDGEEDYPCTVIKLGHTLEDVCHNLFDSLIELDNLGIDRAYVESFEEKGVGVAIMNRLNKAAAYKIL